MRADERASTFPRLGARRSARVEFGGPSDKIVSLVRGHGERLRDSEPSAPKRISYGCQGAVLASV